MDWDFGDGSAHASGVRVSHTYPSPGMFTAALRILDNAGGSGAATATITVESPPENPKNPIVIENARPGDEWALAWIAKPNELEGYAGQASVQHGGTIDIHARSDVAHTLTWDVATSGAWVFAAGTIEWSWASPAACGARASPTGPCSA